MSTKRIRQTSPGTGITVHGSRVGAMLFGCLLLASFDTPALDWGEEHKTFSPDDQWPTAWDDKLYPSPPQGLEYSREGHPGRQSKNPWVFAPEAVTRAEYENPWADTEQFQHKAPFQERGKDSPERWKKSEEHWRRPTMAAARGYPYAAPPSAWAPSPLNPAYGINPIPYGAPFSVPTVPLGVGGYPPWPGAPGLPGWGTPFGRGVPGGLLWY